MPVDFQIVGAIQIDKASETAAMRRIQALARNSPTIKLKVDSGPLGRITGDLKEFDKSLQSASARVIAFTAVTSSIYGVGQAISSITKSFIETEAKFKAIQVVLNTTTQGFEKFKTAVYDAAKNSGQSLSDASDAATELARQGLGAVETINRLNAGLILARQSGLSVEQSISGLTATLNTFQKEALNSFTVLNKLANVDASFAVSSKDLIEALSRSGAAAQDAGVGFDKLISFVTSLQQTTARGGAVIGNSLKSIFTRVERSTTIDALEQFNVATRDLQGNVLTADQLLKNLADTYKDLSRAEQNSVSERVAGIQQINQLKALLADLSRANSVYAQSLSVAGQEGNAAIERNKLLNETLKSQLNAVQVNANQFSSVVGKLTFQPVVKNGGAFLNKLFSGFANQEEDSKSIGQKLGEGVLKGIGDALSGPGLILGASVLANILKGLGKFTLGIVSDYASLNRQTQEQGNLQGAINQILASGNQKYIQRLAAARSVRQEEEAIKSILLETSALSIRKNSSFSAATSNLTTQGVRFNDQGIRIPHAAGGYLPVNQEASDISRGVGGASKSARPAIVPNFNFGGGKSGSIVANTDEYIVPNYNNSGGSAILNPSMVKSMGLPSGARRVNAANGYVPNFVNKYNKNEIGHKGALIDKSYQYIFNDEVTSSEQRLQARKKGFEILDSEDISFLQKNSKLLKGHKLSILDPKSRLIDAFGNSNLFKVTESKSFIGDKLTEANLSKSLSKSTGLSGSNAGEIINNLKKKLGNDFYIKAKSGAQGENVVRIEIKNGEAIAHQGGDIFSQIESDPDSFFGQKTINNISGNEFRVNIGGAKGKSSLLSKALLRSRKGKLASEFLGERTNIGSLFSRRGISNRLSRFIAERQGKRAFSELPSSIRDGAIAGLDVLETGNRGIKKVGQAAAELFGLGKYVKGGGVAEFNFTQSERNEEQFGGQSGYSGSLDIIDVLVNAGKTLHKNSFAGGYLPLNNAIAREQAAGIPLSQIRVSSSPRLSSVNNPSGLAVTNTIDEPGGVNQGINRAIKEGANPKTYNVPNFAIAPSPGILAALNPVAPAAPARAARTALNPNIENRIVEQVLNKLSQRIAIENSRDTGVSGFFKGFGSTRRIDDFAQNLVSSQRVKSLSNGSKVSLEKEVNQLISSQSERRGGRLQNAALLASFGLPVLSQTAASLAPDAPGVGRQAAGIGTALGTGGSVAGALGFSPVGIAIGGVTAAILSLRAAAEGGRKSTEDYAKELENVKGRFEDQRNTLGNLFNAQDQLKEVIDRGGSNREIDTISQQLQQLIKSIDDPRTRNQVLGASSTQDRADILTKISSEQVKSVAEKGIASLTEEIIKPNRGLDQDFFGDTKNVLLNNSQKSDLTTLIGNALPLRRDKDGNVDAGQISKLGQLAEKSVVSLEDLEKTLGKLNIDTDTRKKLETQIARVELESIAKNVVQRNLSAQVINKETETLKKYNSSLLNIGRSLEKLQISTALRFNGQALTNEGVRGRAISGASQSLGAIGDFISPENANAKGNKIRNFELSNDNAGNLERIARDFALSIKDLPSSLQEAFKSFDAENEGGKGGLARSGEELKASLRNIGLNVFANGGNAVDSANLAEKEILKFIDSIKGNKQNTQIVDGLKNFLSTNKTGPVALENERARQAKITQDQTNSINKLILELNKKSTFLGGGNFENTRDLDLSRIQAGSLTNARLRSNNGPFRNRIYKSSGNAFDDSFGPRLTDTNAETARTANVFGSLASGQIDLFKLGLLDDKGKNNARGIVAQAEGFTLQNKIDQLRRGAQNSGDLDLLDQLNGITPQKIGEVAALRATKQIPLEEGQSGPGGTFGKLESIIDSLNSSFKSGLQGDFTKLTQSASEASKALLDVSEAAKLLEKVAKEQALNQGIGEELTKRKDIQTQIQGLKAQQSNVIARNSELFKLSDSTAPDREKFGSQLDASNYPGVDPTQIERFNSETKRFKENKNVPFSEFGTNLLSLGLPKDQLRTLVKDQLDNPVPALTGLNEPVVRSVENNLNIISKRNAQVDDLEKKIKELTDQLTGNKAGGFIPKYAGGLLGAIKSEKNAINSGIGGAKLGDKPYLTNLKGVGPAVVNTGETVIRNFAGGQDAVLNRSMKNRLGIPNYAEGTLDHLSDQVLMDGEEMFRSQEVDTVVEIYKKYGIEGVKKFLAGQKIEGDGKLIANKAEGSLSPYQIELIKKNLGISDYLANSINTTSRENGLDSFYTNFGQMLEGQENVNNFKYPSSGSIKFSPSLGNLAPNTSFNPQIPSLPPRSISIPRTRPESRIFDSNYNNASTDFRKRFDPTDPSNNLDIQDRIRTQGSALQTGGLTTGGLTTGSLDGPRRFGAGTTPEQREARARRDRSSGNNNYQANINQNKTELANVIAEALSKALRDSKDSDKSKSTDQSQNSVEVNNNIKLEISGQINVNNQEIQSIVDEEIAKANELIKARLANLESAQKNNKDFSPVPPKVGA